MERGAYNLMYIDKKNFVLGASIVLPLILHLNIFYMSDGIDKLLWLPLLCVVLFISYCFEPDIIYNIYREDHFLRNYTYITILSVAVVIILTQLNYNQVITRTLREAIPCLVFVLAYPMLAYIIRKGDIKYLFDILNIIALIWFLMIIAQKIIYDSSGTIFISNYFNETSNSEYRIATRNDSIRITLTYVGNLSILYNLYQILYKEKSKRSIFAWPVLLLGVYSLFVIQQTRMFTLAVSICALLLILLDNNRTSWRFLRRILIIIAVISLVYSTGVVGTFIESFSETGENAGSTIARSQAIEYFLSVFRNSPLFGFGFLGVADYRSVVQGPLGTAYIDDVGIFGQLARLGIFVIPIYIWLIAHFSKVVIRTKREGTREDFILYFVLLIYMVVTSFTLCFLDYERCMSIPVFLALFEYQSYKLSNYYNDDMDLQEELEMS